MKVAVVGAGTMGSNHLRVLSEMEEVELVGVADASEAATARHAHRYHIPAFSDATALIGATTPDAVVVAVPTQMHGEVAQIVLDSGCHCLVEKPIAATIAEGERLIESAKRSGKILMVGHVERFNPAVVELHARVERGELGRLFRLDARRLGPFPARVRDVGVVIDLATHDLDIMRYLTRSEVKRVYAETKREIHTSQEDLMDSLIRFDNGALGVLEINWLTPTKVRELSVIGERGLFRVDYLTQDLYFFENAEASPGRWDALSVLRGVSEGPMTRFAIAKKEPLRAELEVFVAAAAGRPAAIVSGGDGLEALRLALSLIESADRRTAIEL